MLRHWPILAPALAACSVGAAPARTDAGPDGTSDASITVADQTIEGDGVVGYAPVEPGVSTDVTVTIQTIVATLFVVLHQDAGREGVFEYSVPDVEQKADGAIAIVPFNVTAENATPMNLTGLCPAGGI